MKVLIAPLKKASRVIMLTSVPNVMKPKDLYMYLNILRPDIFDSYFLYACRYCKAAFKDNRTLYLKDDRFSKNKELSLIMYNKFLVRHLGEDIGQPKARRIVRINMDQDLKNSSEEWLYKLNQQKAHNLRKNPIVSDFLSINFYRIT